MKRYTFNSHTPDSMLDGVVISLRKDGYVAYRETNTLVTNATYYLVELLLRSAYRETDTLVTNATLSCGTSTA